MVSQVLGGRYEVQQQLGKQAGRQTLLGRDFKTQKLVVIKLLTFDSDFGWEDLKLCMREAQAFKALAHPSIPPYLNYFEIDSPTDKGFALVQTYIEGKSLEEQCQSGRTFSEADVKQIGKALLKILTYLHTQEPVILHGNLKPSNILLTNRTGNSVGEVYLVDFYPVQLAVEKGEMNIGVEKGYVPPEQVDGRTVPASELYSLGATLIYLVTGKHPKDLPHKDGQIQFEQTTNLSPTFVGWLRQITQSSLDLRFTSAEKALQALEALSSQRLPKTQKPPQRKAASSVVPKPPSSKVLLTKDANSLEILMPPSGFRPSQVPSSLFAIAWIASVAFWTISSLSVVFPLNVIFVLLSLPIWVVGFSLVYRALFPLLGRTRLHLNQEQISLTHELFLLKFRRPRPAPRQDISKLVFVPKHTTTDFKEDQVEVPSQVVVWAGTQNYELKGTSSTIIGDQEMKYLAQELSNWLGLPITQQQ